MPITQSITVLPTPPSRADPENFDTRADAFLGALPTMQNQMNTWAGQANQTALDIGIVSEGLTSTTAGANKVPMADADGKIDTAWLKVGTGSGDVAAGTRGVTNGDSHDHNGGDGAQIAYSSLSGLPTLGTAAATASTDYAPAAKGVTNGDSHDHNGGDGGQIAYSSLSGLPTLGTAAAAAITDFAAASHNQAETTITFTDITTGNASTTAHGFAPKATAPASGLRSVLAIDNGETVRTDKALFDATNPAALGTASPGSAMTAARRDHVHALPAMGKILQVVATTSTTEVTVESGTYTDIGLSVTITPRDTNSKILLLASFEVAAWNPSGGSVGAHTRLLRGASEAQVKLWTPWISVNGLTASVSYSVLDSPATASAITYKLQGRVSDYASGMYVSFMDGGTSSSLIALEVAG